MGPTKIRNRKMICKTLSASVMNYHFTKVMSNFQAKLKIEEPNETDKLNISSFISGEIKQFFRDQSKLCPTVRVTRRIYPDPEKVAKVQSFFFRPMTQEQKNLEILRNMGPSKMRTQKKLCGQVAACVQSYYFTKAMTLFQAKIKEEDPSEADKMNISSFISAEVKGFFMSRSRLKPRIRSGRILPDPEKVAKVQCFFFRPMTQEQKNLEILRNMGPSKMRTQKKLCGQVAACVQSYYFTKAMTLFQAKIKEEDPSEADKMNISSFISAEVKGFFMSRSRLRPRISSGRILPDPEKMAKVQAHFRTIRDSEIFGSMDCSSTQYQKRYCRRIAIAVRSEIFGQACVHFQSMVKGREPDRAEKMAMCCFIAGEIDGFYMQNDMFPELPKSCFPFYC